ncbi:DUF3298 and DUF4163 domain-containing protein [Helicobacter burdigaliensis]|uniref:DUF3298 and DUF4163 domain-containing protein n=1 Tax=Helicobacter burdigaliensis TaxID=2315334 RepID=UPI000EF6E9C3|nr:DUF3298 and DUF4163 domain-containing protein [Helicobacter burdigaliensis]
MKKLLLGLIFSAFALAQNNLQKDLKEQSYSIFLDLKNEDILYIKEDTKINEESITHTKEDDTKATTYLDSRGLLYNSRFYQLDGFIEDEKGEAKEVRVWAYYSFKDSDYFYNNLDKLRNKDTKKIKLLKLTLPFGLMDTTIKPRSKLDKNAQIKKLKEVEELKVKEEGSKSCQGFEIEGIWSSNTTSSLNGKRFYLCERNSAYSNINLANFSIEQKRFGKFVDSHRVELSKKEVERIKKEFPDKNQRMQKNKLYTSSFTYSFALPYLDNKSKEKEEFNAFYFPFLLKTDDKSKTWKSLEEVFALEFKKLKDKSKEKEEWRGDEEIYSYHYELDFSSEFKNNLKVSYVDENIIAFDFFSYTYTGGAHGMSFHGNKIYSTKDKKELELKPEDVFSKNLLALLEAKIKKEVAKEALFNPEDPINDFPSSFQVNPKGITFIYNVYEIAPYASGAIMLDFSFEELKEVVKKDSPIFYLF